MRFLGRLSRNQPTISSAFSLVVPSLSITVAARHVVHKEDQKPLVALELRVGPTLPAAERHIEAERAVPNILNNEKVFAVS
uniref:Uncharacterized protein n=1 Tax=Solibacter usitatus (strain Ellin6076) TaxID=234267 RepID=Q01WY1_SOLUE